MSGIQSVGTSLEQLERALEQNKEEEKTAASVSSKKQYTDDVIAIGTQAMQRLQNAYPETDAIDEETAREFLQQVQTASPQNLAQAHQALDPERVFRLVGLLG